jgi:cobalamin synthase
VAGLQKTFSALTQKNSRTAADAASIYGLLAVLLVALFKTHSMEVIGESRSLSLLLTPLLARWSLVLFLFGSNTLANDPIMIIARSVRSWHLIATSVATLGFAFYVATTQALWVALSLSLLALLARGFLHRGQGGVSLANCGALVEIGEALSFTLFASL